MKIILNNKFIVYKIFGIIIFLYPAIVNAQYIKDYNDTNDKYTMSSPDVYSFEKYSLNPVNHYVGKPNISIPIYLVKSGNITYPINLVYNTGGIKVDQLSSDVGLGWSLSKAVITRTVNYSNDFDNTGSIHLQSDYNTYSNEEKTQNFTYWSQNNYTGKVGYLLQKEISQAITLQQKEVDFLPDVYNFYSPSYTTNFFFDTHNSVKELNPKGTIIQFFKGKTLIDSKRGYFNPFNPSQWNPNFNFHTQDLTSIVITTNDGIEYSFNDCDYSINQRLNDGYIPLDSPAQVSAWHISKIVDTYSGKKIIFSYDTTSSNPNYVNGVPFYNLGAQRSFEYVENPQTSIQPGCSYYAPSSSQITYKLNITARVDVVKKRLNKITFDDGEIIFNYNNQGISGTTMFSREDIYNGSFLSQVYLKDKNQNIIKTFNLSYNYFNSNYNVGEFNPDGVYNAFRYKRLKLTEFQEIGKPKYKFTYDELTNLPPVNSFSIDYLGYFNNSQDVISTSIIASTRPNPTLYYYPNQFEKSLMPFPLSNLNGQIIPGIFNRQANDYAKAWSLIKVEYPTGGWSEYIYESNKFNILGNEILGGGVRLLTQKINDANSNSRTINYQYLKEIGGTSGTLSSIPYFGHATTTFFTVGLDTQDSPPTLLTPTPSPPFNTNDWKLYEKSNLNQDLTSGSYVGYSRTIENEVGIGRKEFSYTSNDLVGFQNIVERNYPQQGPPLFNGLPSTSTCLIPFTIANSGFASQVFTDNSYKRGKLLEEKVYNNQNQIVKKTSVNYYDNSINTFNYYQGFTRPLHNIGEDNNLGSFLIAKKGYKINQFLPQSKVTINYDLNGNQFEESISYNYNSQGIIKTLESALSNGDVKKTFYFYSNEVPTNSSLGGDILTSDEVSNYYPLKNISNPIQIQEYYNNNLVNSLRKTYSTYPPNMPFPIRGLSKTKISKGSNQLIDNFVVDSYDINNKDFNPSQTSNEVGVKTSYIWGYNKTKLIAKIENCELTTLPLNDLMNIQSLSNSDNDTCTSGTCNEQFLRNALNGLRTTLASSNPNARMTSYTYNPLVGVTSVTDAKSDVQYYIYDSFQRLIKVVDKDNKIVSENAYNYKPQN